MKAAILALCVVLSAPPSNDGPADTGSEPTSRGPGLEPSTNPGEDPDVDYLALASVLLRDGFVERAKRVLDDLDPLKPGLDLEKYWTLTGLVAFRQRRYQAAADAFDRAWDIGHPAPTTQLLVAQARFELQQWPLVIRALDRAGEAAASRAESFVMRAQAWWNDADKLASWSSLMAGIGRHPGNRELRRRRIMMLVKLGLYQTAAREGTQWIAQGQVGVSDIVALAEALRQSRAYDDAIEVLEDARIRYPGETDLSVLLARTWMDAGKPIAAASVMEMVSWTRPELTVEAAELYRRAGRVARAIQVNARVLNQEAKFKQRLGLLLELERYESASALAPRLTRLGLLEHDDIRYAVGYASFRVGEYELAGRVLRGIRDPVIFSRAAELRKAILACKNPGARCQ